MSTTTSRAPTKEAPWKQLFVKHITSMPTPQFVLSTLAETPSLHNPDGGQAPTAYEPRARYCIYRGMWGELPENKHNKAERNPHVFESDCPFFTSDVRMGKVAELFASSAGHATSSEQTQGSGGGGAVEAVWWVEDSKDGENIASQWRMRGVGYVVAEDIEGEDGKESSGVRTVKSELGSRMHCVAEGKEGDWSWRKELRAVFGGQTPGIKSSFKQPPPGQPTSKPYDKETLSMDAKVDSLDDETARKNFRVVVIKPYYVERVGLGDDESRRHVYTFDKESGEWQYEECWP